jgi:hypothetical protein
MWLVLAPSLKDKKLTLVVVGECQCYKEECMAVLQGRMHVGLQGRMRVGAPRKKPWLIVHHINAHPPIYPT